MSWIASSQKPHTDDWDAPGRELEGSCATYELKGSWAKECALPSCLSHEVARNFGVDERGGKGTLDLGGDEGMSGTSF